MKNVIFMTIGFVLFMLSCAGKQQSKNVSNGLQKSDTLDQLLAYFNEKGSVIPNRFCREYLNIEYYDQAYSGCYSEEKRQLNDLHLLVVKLSCMAGGTCESKRLFVIKDRQVKSQLQVGNNSSDMSFENKTSYEFILDTLIEVESSKKEFEYDPESDEEGKLALDSVFYEYYVIKGNGELVKIENRKSFQRKFPETSYRVYTQSELMEYSKDELDTMRNEIFASYGYIFKTEKWKSYFESKEWYNPRIENVNPLLNVVERINIDRILKVSK